MSFIWERRYHYVAETNIELVIFFPPFVSVVIVYSYWFLISFLRPFYSKKHLHKDPES